MSNYNASVLTNKGLALEAKVRAGLVKTKFTKARTGDGEFDDGEILQNVTSLKSPKQEFDINGVSIINDATIYLKFIVTNSQESGNLKQGYYIKEIGIYAEDPDEGEILYAITTGVKNQWDYMPAYNDLMPATITMNFYTEVSNASEVHIEGKGTYVTQEEFDNFKEMHPEGKAVFIDSETGKKYEFGITNGLIYYEEVQENE